MKVYQIKIHHNESLFNNTELNYISAKNFNHAKQKINYMLKLKKVNTSSKNIFYHEEPKIKTIEIISEII